MANPSLKDLLKNNSVTETVQQPPSGVSVTEVNDKTVESNIIAKAETEEQGEVRDLTETELPDPDYKYVLEHGRHKLEIAPEHGLNYNYHVVCSCAWEGRFMTKNDAEQAAKNHIDAHFPRRG